MNEPVPAGITRRGKKLWEETVRVYDLRPDELAVLTEACRETVLVDRLERAVRKAELTTKGSQGQLVTHPLLSEIRQHRSTIGRLLGQLRLPDDVSGEGEGRTRENQARSAAHARWKRGA